MLLLPLLLLLLLLQHHVPVLLLLFVGKLRARRVAPLKCGACCTVSSNHAAARRVVHTSACYQHSAVMAAPACHRPHHIHC
jgi:hypothetical protein